MGSLSRGFQWLVFLEPRAVCTWRFTAALYRKRSRWRSLLLANEVQRNLQASEYGSVRTGTQIKSHRLRHRYSPMRAFYFYKAKISVDLPVSLQSARGPLFPSLATLLLFLVLIWTVLLDVSYSSFSLPLFPSCFRLKQVWLKQIILVLSLDLKEEVALSPSRA